MKELRYTRIGGWLILFVFANGLGGLLNSLKFFSEFSSAIAISPPSIFSAYVALDAFLMIAIGIFQLIVVYQMLKLKPNALKAAKQLLLFMIIASAASATICLFFVFNDVVRSSAALDQFVINRIMTVFAALIWLLYFKMSKRVKRTFSDDSTVPPQCS